MADLVSRLRALPQKIRVAIIGVGSVGKGLAYQAGITPGMECVAIADLKLEQAVRWAEQLGRNPRLVDSLGAMHDTIREGRMAVCSDGSLLARCDLVDVVVDASNSVSAGLQFAVAAIAHHKHVIMMNTEADLIFGPHLLGLAQREGVVYSSADGDQHTVLMRLIREIEFWGFRTVLAGNMKGYLDRYSNPTTIVPEADKRFMDYRMCTSYTDGTKLCVEMALVANCIGGRTVTAGMLGPRIHDIYEAADHFDFGRLWDGNTPLVDYVLGASPPGGVFAIGHNDHPHQMETLGWYPCRLGRGPFYLFHRPYHLGHFETMRGVAEAFLDGSAVLQPAHGLVTNVYAYAKQELLPGQSLDGVGGYASYGLIENTADNQLRPGLPSCLAEDVTLRRPIRKDEKIYFEDVDYDPSQPRFEAYRQASGN